MKLDQINQIIILFYIYNQLGAFNSWNHLIFYWMKVTLLNFGDAENMIQSIKL